MPKEVPNGHEEIARPTPTPPRCSGERSPPPDGVKTREAARALTRPRPPRRLLMVPGARCSRCKGRGRSRALSHDGDRMDPCSDQRECPGHGPSTAFRMGCYRTRFAYSACAVAKRSRIPYRRVSSDEFQRKSSPNEPAYRDHLCVQCPCTSYRGSGDKRLPPTGGELGDQRWWRRGWRGLGHLRPA